VVGYTARSSLIDASWWIGHTDEVKLAIVRGELDVARGDRTALKADEAKLASLTRDNHVQQQKLSRAIELTEHGSYEDLDSTLDSMRAEENRLLAERNLRSRSAQLETFGALAFTATLTVALGLGAFVLLQRQIAQRLAAELAVERNERKLADEQNARRASEAARKEMERVSHAKDEFLATMSHELRTPLNAICGWAAILKRKDLDGAKIARGLEVIERNARTQARLVSDLLDVSRIIAGKLRIVTKKVEIAAIIRGAADVVRPAADAKGLRLVLDVDPDVGSAVVDPDRIHQIIWNLLTNAIRFTPRGGRITLQADRAESSVLLAVQDTGAGIAEEHLPLIFERFRQVDSSTTRAHGGLGLGLALVRHLVEAHGGSVEAQSGGIGRGSTFIVKLPIATASAEQPGRGQPAASAAPSLKLPGLRVLVVDDDQDSIDLLRVVLESAGASVTTASSAAEALEAKGPFDVILSDIGMPEVDGYTFMRRIRAREGTSHVPAIALTAYSRDDDAERARQAGYQERLSKPVDHETLVACVSAWSRSQNAELH
jgi:signal transduction histidine kinase/ActR/RegA family two-component response regulator